MKPQDSPESEHQRSAEETRPRKVYATPELQVYGDLTELTKSISATNSNDASGHPNKHFTS